MYCVRNSKKHFFFVKKKKMDIEFTDFEKKYIIDSSNRAMLKF